MLSVPWSHLFQDGGCSRHEPVDDALPVLFHCEPCALLPEGPRLLERFDFFELWAVFLLWVLVQTRPGSTKLKARVVTVWCGSPP